jgi:nucleotide sugar dehydrogenase
MTIGILGIGRLGLCFALNLERSGYEVKGVDISEEYIAQLSAKTFFSYEPEVNELLRASKNFTATTDIKELISIECDLLFIMVATPSLPDGSYDHSQIDRVAGQLAALGKRQKKVILAIGSTVMPGYCNKLQQQLGELNYTIAYNPGFIAQGSIIQNQVYCDQILIGETELETGDVLTGIYSKVCRSNPAICRMNLLSAEISKIATNCFLTTKISFANSIGDLALQAGAEPEKILAAIGADSRIGEKYLHYGFGFGGPCLPRDNRALNFFANQSGYNLLISEVTDKVNEQHLQFQFDAYMARFDPGQTIIMEEVVYKKGTVYLDESQKLLLAIKLVNAGRKVLIREKQPVIDELKRLYGSIFAYESITT